MFPGHSSTFSQGSATGRSTINFGALRSSGPGSSLGKRSHNFAPQGGANPMNSAQRQSSNNSNNGLAAGRAAFGAARGPNALAAASDDSATTSALADYYPEDLIYDVENMVRLQGCKALVPEKVMVFAADLWKQMPECRDSMPAEVSQRGDLFGRDNSTTLSKVLKDRKIYNEVLGILGRVTKDNLEKMKEELTNLPIRQSTADEIERVINVFFTKSIRPEDSVFAPLYVQLIAHLIRTYGEKEEAGINLRYQIVKQCQKTFVEYEDVKEALQKRTAEMSEEDAETERIQFVGTQKANVYFLGLLYNHRLVSERVVASVMINLLRSYREDGTMPKDYEVLHLLDILLTCGKKLMQCPNMPELVGSVCATLRELQECYPQQRVKFLVMNTLETIDNNWEPVHGPNAKLAAQRRGPATPHQTSPFSPNPGVGNGPSFAGQKPRTGGGAGAGGDHAERAPSITSPQFQQMMDRYFQTSDLGDSVEVIQGMPEGILVSYLSKWLSRYIMTTKYASERKLIGALLDELVSRKGLPIAVARKGLVMHLEAAIEEDLFTEAPKYFANWAEMIRSGREVFPSSLHTVLLDMLIAAGVQRRTVVRMVTDVHRAGQRDSAPNSGGDVSPHQRFRVLPALLRYNGEDAFDMEDEMGSGGEECRSPGSTMDGDGLRGGDILLDVRTMDREVDYFLKLCEISETANGKTMGVATTTVTNEYFRQDHSAAFPLVAAFFTFARYDVELFCLQMKDALKKILTVRQVAPLLEEVFITWKALEPPEETLFLFIKTVARKLGLNGFADQLDKFKKVLRSDKYKEDDLVSRLEHFMK